MQTISIKKAEQLLAKQAVVVDFRDAIAYRDGNISGSVNLTLRRIHELLKHPKNTKIIVLSDDEPTLTAAVNYIEQYGFTNVHPLKMSDEVKSLFGR